MTEEKFYSALRGKITEKCGNQDVYAKKLGISRQALNNKLIKKSDFTQAQIIKSIEILGLNDEEVVRCFLKV